MSKMRDRTLRKRTGRRRLVITTKVSDEEKLRTIRALYITVYNGDVSLIPQSVELFHLLGDILEGKSIHDLADNILVNSLDYATLLGAYEDLEPTTPA